MSLKEVTNGNLWILGTAGAPVVGMVVFAVVFARRQSKELSARVEEAGGSVFLSRWVMEYAYWFLEKPVALLVRLKVSPNAITLGGLAVVSCGCALVAGGYFGLAGPLVLVGSLSDMLDGAVARQLGRCSQAGEFMDAMVDRYADLALLCGLAFFYHDRLAALGVVLLAMLGCITVSYARAKAESLGVHDVPSGAMRRAERTVYLGFAVHLSPLVARLVEAPAAAPRYDLALAMCALIALVCNFSTLQMMTFTVRRLGRA